MLNTQHSLHLWIVPATQWELVFLFSPFDCKHFFQAFVTCKIQDNNAIKSIQVKLEVSENNKAKEGLTEL